MPLRVVDCAREDFRQALADRGLAVSGQISNTVAQIIEQVRAEGDEALLGLSRRFDAPNLQSLEVTQQELEEASVSPDEEEAIRLAYQRILDFHRRQLDAVTQGWIARNGGYEWQIDSETRLGQRMTALQRVGIYVPGGGAAYPSSVLMLAGPAQAAGVKDLVCATPARADGTLHPGVLVALRTAGIESAYKVGGAGAIAALALGTQSIPRVDKIAGPGNRYVNEAKRQLWGAVGLDGFAGPSEVCVLSDGSGQARFVIADFLAQIEHAPDNAGFLVCIGPDHLEELQRELERQLREAPRRNILDQAIKNESLAFLAHDIDQAIELVNFIAPEHLTLSVREPESLLSKVKNAGCVLMGEWTPESAADYALGPSHTLPTGGAARFASPVNVLDFLTIQSFAALTREQSKPICHIAETFGNMEGLPAHAYGAAVRSHPPTA